MYGARWFEKGFGVSRDRMVDMIASYFVPIVIVIAIITFMFLLNPILQLGPWPFHQLLWFQMH
ncbi:MAG: hypothetical protein ACPL6D_02115 [Thermodesulfobacteriota bacterium]